MSTFAGITQIAPSDTWTNSSTDIGMVLGQVAVTPDGRIFRYGVAGGTNLATNKLNQSSAIVANLQNMAVTTNAVGDTVVNVTPGGSITIAANLFAGGFLTFNAGTGLGQTLQVYSHAAQTASTAAFNVTLVPDDAIKVATSSSDTKASMIANTYKNVIISPTTNTGTIAGVNPVAITASQYGFFQTTGLVGVLSDATVAAAGAAVAPSTTTAGSVTLVSGTTSVPMNQIGYAAQLGVSAEYRYVNLCIG